MKKLPALILALTISLSFSACEEKPEELPEPAETTAVSEVTTSVPVTTAKPVTTTVPETTSKPAETISPEIISSADNYKYQPTDSIKNISWYHDNIMKELEYETHSEYELTTETTYDEVLESFYKILPKRMVDDVLAALNRNHILREETDKAWDMYYTKFDIDSDGIEDYIINMNVGEMDLSSLETIITSHRGLYGVGKIVLMNADGTYKIIDLPDEYPRYVLPTKTNGMHDFLVGNDGNAPVMRYEMGKGYVSYDESDERHMFGYAERVNDSIIKINLKISVRHDMESDYYTAVKFMDNPYLKENVLYACEPDGTTKVYDKDFEMNAIDGYDFYAELKDGAELPEDYMYEFFPDEIRYVFEHGTENYRYQPPKEVAEAHFHGAEIEKQIEFERYEPEFYDWKIFYDEDCREKLLEDFSKHYPKEIVRDMDKAMLTEMGIIDGKWADDGGWFSEKEKINSKIISMGHMMYDMNSDGVDDYVMTATASQDGGNQFAFNLYRIYLVNADGTFTSIRWDSYMQWNFAYIQKTSTNGLKDIMILHNADYPIITYDGKNSYTDLEMLDEKHTFVSEEILPNNILHYNVNIFVKGADEEEYYAAIYMADNPYLENNLLYSCYPDGTLRTHLKSEHNRADYSYDFYVKLKDGADIYDGKGYLDITQIKYIPAK